MNSALGSGADTLGNAGILAELHSLSLLYAVAPSLTVAVPIALGQVSTATVRERMGRESGDSLLGRPWCFSLVLFSPQSAAHSFTIRRTGESATYVGQDLVFAPGVPMHCLSTAYVL